MHKWTDCIDDLAFQPFKEDEKWELDNRVALLTVLKKIDFDLSMLRVASRRHIFEANVNGFTLVLQVHGAKPFDDLAQQASVRLG